MRSLSSGTGKSLLRVLFTDKDIETLDPSGEGNNPRNLEIAHGCSRVYKGMHD